MKRYRQVAGFILAGGASSRMGVDKGLLDFGGVPLLVHTARLLESLVGTVTVVGTPHRYAALGLQTIADHVDVENPGNKTGADLPSYGPLAGISAALSETRSRWNLIVGCDMPYLSEAWLRWLVSRALRSRAEAVVPQTKRGLEPLAALYGRECRTKIALALARGEPKVTNAILGLRLELVSPREWRHIHDAGLVLKNMNAPSDYEEALAWRHRNRMGLTDQVREPGRAPKPKRQVVPRPRK